MFSMVESVKTLFLSHLPKNWECSGNVLMNIHLLRIDEGCLVWLETFPGECIDLLNPSFLE